MISMTGFGRATVDTEGGPAAGRGRLRVEIRSVNHRGLDLKIRAPQPDAFCEAELGRAVRAAVERGSVTVHIREEAAPARGGLEGEALWEVLRPGVERALAELVATRKREGAALTEDIGGRVGRLAMLVAQIREATAILPERYARRIEERLAALREQPGFEPGRIAQEAALMAERLDVSEELVRLDAHLSHLSELLRAPGAVGRKLDFVVQEVGRELNTIGSKAQDANVAALVIEGKAELEKLREQAQNIE